MALTALPGLSLLSIPLCPQGPGTLPPSSPPLQLPPHEPAVSRFPLVLPSLAQAQAFLGADGVTGEGDFLIPREP